MIKNLNILFIGLFFSSVASACSPLPSDLQAYMKSLDVQYTPIDKKDLHPGIVSAYEDAVVCINADFDGDGRTDYALAVTDPNPPMYEFQKANVKVIVFFRKESGYVHKILPYQIGYDLPNANEIGLIMAPANGRVETLVAGESDVEIKPVHLENTGIQLGWFYIPVSYVFYWKNSDFVKAPISD